VPAVVERFQREKHERVRAAMALMLGEVGSEARNALPFLRMALRKRRIQADAALALGAIGASVTANVPWLIRALRDRDRRVRRWAAWALGLARSELAVPVLVDLSTDKDADIRLIARCALHNINPREYDAGDYLYFRGTEWLFDTYPGQCARCGSNCIGSNVGLLSSHLAGKRVGELLNSSLDRAFRASGAWFCRACGHECH